MKQRARIRTLPPMNAPGGSIQRKMASDAASIDGAALLEQVGTFLARFVVYPSPDALVAHVLWIAHTHLMAHWESTPRLAFLSPEKESGKTRAIELSVLLVPQPVEAINATPAYIFRKISDEAGLPTILYDEIDTVFGPKAKEHEDVRALLNAGHRRGAVAGRCVVRGKVIETEELPAYCAVALAGIGSLPDTILSRSIAIPMRRRRADEPVEPFRHKVHGPEGAALRDQIAMWTEHLGRTTNFSAAPLLPDGVVDRNADCWEPLVVIADAAGGPWPQRARGAAVAIVAATKAHPPSLGVRLLADIRVIFGDAFAMATNEALEKLNGLEEAPWAELKGGPLNARRLAALLRPYGVGPKPIRIGAGVVKGYTREDLSDPWSRYLDAPSLLIPQERVTSVTSVTSDGPGGVDGAPDVTDVTAVTGSRRNREYP